MKPPGNYDPAYEKGTFEYATVEDLETILELLPRIDVSYLEELLVWVEGDDYWYRENYSTGVRFYIERILKSRIG